MRFLTSTTLLPLLFASLVSSSISTNASVDSIQQSAYLAKSSAPHIVPNAQHNKNKRFKKLDKRLRKEVEDEWTVHKGVASHLEKKRLGVDAHGKEKKGGKRGRMEKLRVRGLKSNGHLLHMRHSPPPQAAKKEKGIVELVKKEISLEKRGGGGMFKGVSSYYLFALDDGPRRQVLDAIKGGGFSVVRIFLSGVGWDNKGSGNQAVPDRMFHPLSFSEFENESGS